MNTKFSLILVFVVLILTGGCQSLIEDPKGSLTPGTYFKTQADLDASVSAIYIQFARDGAWGFTNRSTSYFGSDDFTTDPGLNKEDFRLFDRLSGGSGNGSLVAQWQGPWQGIYQANNVIANYAKVSSTDVLKNQAAGQAYFLRALGYYYLVRTFGPVPIILTQIDVNDRPARDPVDKVYAAIINDLQKAKEFLPVSFPGQPGKANQMAARALLADVYLSMTGWPLNQASNYDLAAAEANSVMQSGKYDVNTPYATVFTTNNSSESIFGFQYNVSGGLPLRSAGSSSVPLDEIATNGSSGWDDYYPEINFYKNAPKCSRTDATFYTTIKLRQPDGKTFKLVSWDSPETHAGHPYYKKFRAGLNGDGVSETETTINAINPSTNKVYDVIRYPLVLLAYAEASAMASGPTAASYNAINLVRKRAGLPNLTTGLSAQAFRDSVVYERAYEFAGEFGVRWFDIVRLQLLPKVIASRSPLENPIPANTNVSQKYLAPIPVNEMARNPAWVQNDGY
ncbi:RagB/SusD family nutrient uptake outer membrane protein [Spirosoma sp. HMF4905]|uniref:RagB/SusD family nutrient uptake outer membrane protein n=1 Tax=Spirosoma arboris TaxID=2682092 RepID=A0A7K1S418_9BACT|nr:RagB/SusD family nutrient uptake outer membrane protein [Spirosoma arboris]MVM28559.1 RagB/SusD family nutrient uptake outer membrane protein [Spirosoma arboris]